MKYAARAHKNPSPSRKRSVLFIPIPSEKANAALCEFVADALGLPKRAVRVVAGETAREKTLFAAGADPARAAAALAPPGDPAP